MKVIQSLVCKGGNPPNSCWKRGKPKGNVLIGGHLGTLDQTPCLTEHFDHV